jgi:hypothetical protein
MAAARGRELCDDDALTVAALGVGFSTSELGVSDVAADRSAREEAIGASAIPACARVCSGL